MGLYCIVDLTCDPYKMDERDPVKCDALKSSLWELKVRKTSKYHFYCFF